MAQIEVAVSRRVKGRRMYKLEATIASLREENSRKER